MGSEQAVLGVRTPQPQGPPGDAPHITFITLWTAWRTMDCSAALLCLLGSRQTRANAG